MEEVNALQSRINGLESKKKEVQKRGLEYYEENAREDYILTPISVLRYITELEFTIKEKKTINYESN